MAANRTGIILIVGGIVLALAVVCLAIGVVLGLPAYFGYVQASKTGEATANLRAIEQRLEAYRAEFGRYPPDLRPAPVGAPGPDQRLWDGGEDWRTLGFEPYEPVYFSYEVDTSDDGQTYVARARGDLDGDGTQSLVELAGPNGQLRIENELE
jgi:type II secretory pathway pseudopilin PulG